MLAPAKIFEVLKYLKVILVTLDIPIFTNMTVNPTCFTSQHGGWDVRRWASCHRCDGNESDFVIKNEMPRRSKVSGEAKCLFSADNKNSISNFYQNVSTVCFTFLSDLFSLFLFISLPPPSCLCTHYIAKYISFESRHTFMSGKDEVYGKHARVPRGWALQFCMACALTATAARPSEKKTRQDK